MNLNKWSEGSSRNADPSVVGADTDCSSWESEATDQSWTVGRSRNADPSLLGSTTDCGKWEREAPVSIAIQLTYSHQVNRDTVAADVISVVETIQKLDPPLGLIYDEQRSRENLADCEVRIVLVPTRDVENVPDRMWELLGRVRRMNLGLHESPVAVSYECLHAA